MKAMKGQSRRRWILGLLMASLLSCVPQKPIRPLYNPRTPNELLRDWGDAFNTRDIIQLRLLIHPPRRNAFDAEQTRMMSELTTIRIDHFLLGHEVRVNDTMPGYEVMLYVHDGRRMTEKGVIIVKSEGRWWFWKY